MAIKSYKPQTPSLRGTSNLSFEGLAKKRPEKALSKGLSFKGGRGAGGHISVRRKGGGHKRKYRVIDFKRDNHGVSGTVVQMEYDPNRTANIALVKFANGNKRYILAPKGLMPGAAVSSGENAPIQIGNALPLEKIPLGMSIHNIELKQGRGGQVVRSAGGSAVLVAKEGDFVTVRLPSGEMRMIFKKCYATLGEVGNEDWMNVTLGKAGRSRWRGKRPKVRGVAMNPIDHPHGGGEGRSSGGRHPVSPSGVPTKGFKTRRRKKYSDKFIVKKRR
jgi:large subunit ribosomal protein L2